MDAFRKILIETIGLKDHHVDELIRIMHVKTYHRKEFLITEGTVCNFIGFISKGLMRSFVTGKGKECNTDFYFDNYFISAYSSFITQLPTVHTIQALTETEVCCLSLTQYNELIEADVEWLRLGKYVGEFFLVRKCQREMSFLKQTAAERIDSMLIAYPGIEQTISQYHIASYLGIKPESLSRIKLLDYISSKPQVL